MTVLLTLVASVLAGACVCLVWPDPRRQLRRSARQAHPAGAGDGRQERRTLVGAGGAVALMVGGGLAGGWFGLVLAVTAAEFAALCGWLLVRRRAARTAVTARAEVARACALVAAQLRQGMVASDALRSASEDTTVLDSAVAALHLGGEVPLALLAEAERPGQAGLADLARAWQVSSRTGAPMAGLLGRVSDALRDDKVVAAMADTELAAPRATSRMLAALPVVGVAMGFGLGGNPVDFLAHTLVGHVCWLLGVTLACAGVAWTERLAVRAGGLTT